MNASVLVVVIGLLLGSLRWLNRRGTYTDVLRDFDNEMK